jgi:hypothetical protein
VGPRLESVRRAPDEGKQWAAIAWVLGELGARCVAAADRQFLANEPFVVVHGTVRLDGAPETLSGRSAAPEGERVVDLGSSAGFDCFRRRLAGRSQRSRPRNRHDPRDAGQGPSHGWSTRLGSHRLSRGIIDAIPVEDGWADVVMSNGALNLVADKRAALAEAFRILPRRRSHLCRHQSVPFSCRPYAHTGIRRHHRPNPQHTGVGPGDDSRHGTRPSSVHRDPRRRDRT